MVVEPEAYRNGNVDLGAEECVYPLIFQWPERPPPHERAIFLGDSRAKWVHLHDTYDWRIACTHTASGSDVPRIITMTRQTPKCLGGDKRASMLQNTRGAPVV